jgi:hypothetical protein
MRAKRFRGDLVDLVLDDRVEIARAALHGDAECPA